jgi:hypothetical protein
MLPVNLSRFATSVLTLVFAASAAPALLAADNCKDVKITIHNGTADEVKLKSFDYYDYDKNKSRHETLFPVDGIQKLEPSKGLTWTRDLESVGGDETKFKVTYAHHIGGTKWGSDLTATTDKFTCSENLTKTVTLSK